ncbi:hypothetical protein SLA2020_473160 [Shorea laevis]
MAPLHRFLFVATVAVASLLALSPSPASAIKQTKNLQQAPSKLIESVCKSDSVDDYNFCIKALSSPQAISAPDAKALTPVVLQLAQNDAKATRDAINALMKTQNFPALAQCLENYENAIRSFGMVTEELEEDPMTANYDIKVNTDLADECDRALAAGEVPAPQISAGNLSLRRFALIGFQVTNLL